MLDSYAIIYSVNAVKIVLSRVLYLHPVKENNNLLNRERLDQEVVHTRVEGALLERDFPVSRATANHRELVLSQKRASHEKVLDGLGDCGAVHLGHAVVEQDKSVHLRLAPTNLLEAFLDQVERLRPAQGNVSVHSQTLDLTEHHLYGGVVVVDYQN